MLNFIWEYRFIIIAVVAIVLYALFQWNVVKAKLYALMLQAKSLAKDAVLKSGTEQVNWVVEKAYVILPKVITAFVPVSTMETVINYLYSKGKDLLDDGKINGSVE
jgi:hypothetical protein